MTKDWVLAVGCSLTWGSEITELGESLPEDKLLAYPAQFGKLLNAKQLINRGWPGRSNSSIFRIAMEDMAKYVDELGTNGVVVVQWSGRARIEIVNPFKFQVDKIYNQKNHPGQESGPYLNLGPAEISDPSVQKQFTGLYHYFLNHWAHEFYQIELLINYSVALTSLANKLGVTVLQFNGIDAINPTQIPLHATSIFNLIGSEYYCPVDESKTFWRTYQKIQNGGILPTHPTAEDHADWANVLYNYMLEIQSAKLA
jgi:hypothetical protein